MRAASLACVALLVLGCGSSSTLSPRATETATEGAASGSESATEGTASATEGPATEGTASAAEGIPESPAAESPAPDSPAPESPAAESPAPVSPSAFPASSGYVVQVAILEREAAELEQAAALIARAREEAEAQQNGIPRICQDRTSIEALRLLGTSGSIAGSQAIRAAHALERWCEPFVQWQNPTDRAAQQIRSYLQNLDRVAGWLQELRACERGSGAERARCENTYSDLQRATVAEAGRALQLLDAHQQELGSVRSGTARFPCVTDTLLRIESERWVGPLPRAQMASLPQRARSVCDVIGVSEQALREAGHTLRSNLDQAESSVRGQRRVRLETADALRPYIQ